MSIRVVEAREEADKLAVYRFLYELWAGELGRELPGMDPERGVLVDALDAWAHHLMALDGGGNIVGTVRLNELHEGEADPELAERVGLGELLQAFAPEEIGYSSRLAVAPHKRGHTVTSRLVTGLFQRLLGRGVRVDVSCCPLELVSVYYQVGYRPYLPPFRVAGLGLRQPMVLCTLDRGHLLEVESPAAELVPASLDDDGATALALRRLFPEFRDPGFDRVSSRALWARLARPTVEREERDGLLEGFAAYELETIAPHVVRQYFLPGQYVYRRGEREPGMGVVLSGSLGVVLGEASSHVLAVLGPSEPFGELQALGPGERSADVVALERSEVLLLPPDFVDRVGRADPELGFRLARRLLGVLGRRLVAANGELLAAGRSSVSPTRSRRPAVYELAPDLSEQAPPEAFVLAELGAGPEEARALSLRAGAVGTLELPALLGAGLEDGQRVLDLAAGAGIFASALLRRFPACTLVGLQPDPRRRALAEGILARQGVAGRCTLVEGEPAAIPLPDDCVDFAYARLVLQQRRDPGAVLAELRRVTRPGGVVCVLDADDGSVILHPPSPAWELLRERLAEVKRGEGGDRGVGRKLFGLLRGCGLRAVHADLLTLTPGAVGPEAFRSIAFDFIPTVLRRGGVWDEESQGAFDALVEQLEDPSSFASSSGFLVHGLVP
jgi:CRP-like cAMP-binding protein/SAM-dependent methyltransferase/predicted GNAT family N-acyltransferase